LSHPRTYSRKPHSQEVTVTHESMLSPTDCGTEQTFLEEEQVRFTKACIVSPRLTAAEATWR
jgi:hypothetical protein